MTKNPFYNAIFAIIYIILIVTLITWGSHLSRPEDNFVIPIAMLSLFVLSAATMGYIFLYEPALMILDGQRKEGIKLFLSTLGTFAVIAIIVFLVSVLAFR